MLYDDDGEVRFPGKTRAKKLKMSRARNIANVCVCVCVCVCVEDDGETVCEALLGGIDELNVSCANSCACFLIVPLRMN